jgi:hypothetical protein
VEDNIQVENEPRVSEPEKDEERFVAKKPEISAERIERMKKAFKPTWLHEQINSNGGKTAGPSVKKE